MQQDPRNTETQEILLHILSFAMNADAHFEAVQCPSWAVSLGYLGVSAAVVLSNFGSAVSSLFVAEWLSLRVGLRPQLPPSSCASDFHAHSDR